MRTMAPYAGAATSATIDFDRTNVRKPNVIARDHPALWSEPPGLPGVAYRRGTGGCPGIVSEARSEHSV